jgi:hypothetical protein
VGSWGADVVRFARRELGIELDRWQVRAITRALAVDAEGRLVHREYLVSTARQQGKTALVRALIGWALTTDSGPAWALLYGIAYNRPQARIPYTAVLSDLAELGRRVGHESRGGLALTRYLGIRSAMHGWRREYHVTSREARDALRGYSIDLALFDEVRTQRDDETYAALKPTVSARPEPLIFEISSAGDERSVLLRALWERGRRIIDGAEPAEGFGMTWYAADDADAPDDPRAWRKSSPAFADGRFPVASIRDELRALTGSTFRRERLNLWADAADEWLPPGVWARQGGTPPATLAGRVVLGVESDPGWSRASIAVAIDTPDAPLFTGLAAELVADPGSTVGPAELLEALERVRAAYSPALVVWSRGRGRVSPRRVGRRGRRPDARALAGRSPQGIGALPLRARRRPARARRRSGTQHASAPGSAELVARGGRVVLLRAREPRRDRRAPSGRVGVVGRALARARRAASRDLLTSSATVTGAHGRG